MVANLVCFGLKRVLVAYFFMAFPSFCMTQKVNSLHGVRPAAPQAPLQPSHVKHELGEAEIIDLTLIERSVAA